MKDLPRKTILIVDDVPENIDVLAAILSDDYNVKIAINGEKTIKIASKTPPDLILLDIMLPDLDGYEVCRRLKQNDATKKIPVIFVTAGDEIADETLGFEAGAVDFLTKPVNPHLVRASVKTHLAVENF